VARKSYRWRGFGYRYKPDTPDYDALALALTLMERDDGGVDGGGSEPPDTALRATGSPPSVGSPHPGIQADHVTG